MCVDEEEEEMVLCDKGDGGEVYVCAVMMECVVEK